MRSACIAVLIVLAVLAVACDVATNPAAPTLLGRAGVPSIQNSATVTVLDGANPSCDGVCIVTKWPLHPVEDWTPTYVVQSYNDPCTTKWGSPWHTYARIDHDDDPWTSSYYWCQQ